MRPYSSHRSTPGNLDALTRVEPIVPRHVRGPYARIDPRTEKDMVGHLDESSPQTALFGERFDASGLLAGPQQPYKSSRASVREGACVVARQPADVMTTLTTRAPPSCPCRSVLSLWRVG